MTKDISNNPSLAISAALERRPKMLPLRATFDSINLRVFADNKQLQQIDNANWQVLFGRRGAGKTTLLATYATYITRNLFKTNQEFETLIEGAGGLPRDFVEMFDTLARSRDFSVAPPWNMKEVKACVREHCVKNKQPDLGQDPVVYEVFKDIVELIRKNNSRLILIKRNSNRRLLSVIGEFYHKRLLHDVPLLNVPVLIRPKFYMYFADLGLLYDTNRKLMDEIGETADSTQFGAEDGPEELKKFVLVFDSQHGKNA